MYGFLGELFYIILFCGSIYIFEQSKSKAEKKLIANAKCVSKITSLSSSLESLERSCERLQYDYDLNKDVIDNLECARNNLDKAWLCLNEANNSLHTKQTGI